MGFIMQIVAAAILAAVFQSLGPHVLRLVKPYAVRAAGGVTHQFFVGLCVGVMLGVFPALIGGVKFPSIDWPVIDIPDIVIPSGPRRILIVRETADATPQLNGELVLMRKDPIATHLNAKGHRLDILDLDAKGADGSPIKAVTEFKTNYPNLKPPAILIQAENNAVIHAESLPADVKAAAILETIKAKE